uniref:Uncharacterized protein n=1 Tax=Arundo donax TaxID=35708 RepID=A0A0A9FN33_ARUDO
MSSCIGKGGIGTGTGAGGEGNAGAANAVVAHRVRRRQGPCRQAGRVAAEGGCLPHLYDRCSFCSRTVPPTMGRSPRCPLWACFDATLRASTSWSRPGCAPPPRCFSRTRSCACRPGCAKLDSKDKLVCVFCC